MIARSDGLFPPLPWSFRRAAAVAGVKAMAADKRAFLMVVPRTTKGRQAACELGRGAVMIFPPIDVINRLRALANLDITVPIGTSVASAISR